MSVILLGADPHQQVQALLPWYVGASLGAEERARVEAHVAECPRCQAELAWERGFQAAYASVDTQGDIDQGFALLRARIAGDTAPRPRDTVWMRLADRWRECPPWTRWALLAQCVLVAALSVALLLPLATEQRYRALGGPQGLPAPTGNLIVRFRPEATEQDMRRLLRETQARLVYGPTTTDAYLLAVPVGLETAAVKQLRQERAVLLVESLDGRAAP